MKKRKAELIGSLKLNDPRFLGNDSASDEAEELFFEYAYERPDVAIFSSMEQKISILHAPKGAGKSALCILSKRELREKNANALPVLLFADKVESWTGAQDYPNSAGHDERQDLSSWRAFWIRRILSAIAATACHSLGLQWGSDVAKSIIERDSFGGGVDCFCNLLKRNATPLNSSINNQGTNVSCIVAFIDEVDANFTGTKYCLDRLAGFFLAIQDLSREFKDLYFRLTVRPNVWAQLYPQYASLLTFRQYLIDLSWTTEQLQEVVRNRVDAYLRKSISNFSEFEGDSLEILFDDTPFDLGSGDRGPVSVLATLASFRPRWLIELLRSSGGRAFKNRANRVCMNDIRDGMFDFGSARIKDLAAEYRCQCDYIEDLVHSLSSAYIRFKDADALLKYLAERVKTIPMNFTGFYGYTKSEAAARLLVLMDVIHGRFESKDRIVYKHFRFSDIGNFPKNPELYKDLQWEIHPMFRDVLRLQSGEFLDNSLERFRKRQPSRKSKRRR